MSETKQVARQHKRGLAMRWARGIVAAKKRKAQADFDLKRDNPKFLEVMEDLGWDEINIGGETLLQVIQREKKQFDEASIETYIKRYRPELYDTLFPATRTLNKKLLAEMLSEGQLPETINNHITTAPMTPQVRIQEGS